MVSDHIDSTGKFEASAPVPLGLSRMKALSIPVQLNPHSPGFALDMAVPNDLGDVKSSAGTDDTVPIAPVGISMLSISM